MNPAGGKKKFSPVKPTKSTSSNPRSDSPSSAAKKNVLKALNDQLKIRAQKLETKKAATPQKNNVQQHDEPTPSQTPTPSRIPVSVKAKTPKELPPTPIRKSVSPSVAFLRQKCLSRKFLYVWMHRTFGRVLPSRAREFYEKRVVKKVFHEWYDEWWTEKMEWRLTIRAQCHDRYRQYRHVWNSWKQYVIMSRIKKAKFELAGTHHGTTTLSLALAAWKEYVQTRRYKQQLDRRAMEFAERNLMQTCWDCWREQHRLIGIYKELDNVALRYWSTQSTTKAWVQWKLAGEKVQLQKRKEALATEHHHTLLRVRALEVLRSYAFRRRQKKQIKANVDTFYCRKMVRHFFATWSHRRMTLSMIRHREKEIDQSGQAFRLRRAFEHWRHYVDMKRQKFANGVVADEHYRENVLSTALTGLRLAVADTKIQQARKRLADQFQESSILTATWRLWVSRCDQNEEIRAIPQRRRAERYHHLVLMKKCVKQWLVYVDWRRRRQGDYIRADAYYTTRALPRYLAALYENAQLSMKKRSMKEKAVAFHGENVKAKFFYVWLNELEQLRERRTMTRIAILHHQDTLVAGTFLQWKITAEVTIATRENETMATRHCELTLCARVLEAWRECVRREKDHRQNKRLALQYHHGNRLERAWLSWKQSHERRRTEKHQLETAARHHGNRLLRVTTDAWLLYHGRWRQTEASVERKVRNMDLELMRETFREWRLNAQEAREEHRRAVAADGHHYARLASTVLRLWAEAAAMSAFKRSRTEGEILQARETLDESLLRRYFRRWSSRRDEELLRRLRYQQALIHHGRRLEKRCLDAWRGFVTIQRRNKLLRHQATWFDSTRSLVSGFVQWKACHAERQRENEQTGVALWQWSLVLQAKVFTAWMAYTRERHRKKERWATAMGARMDYLRTEAVRQWLTTASSLQSMRENWTANKQAKTVYHIHHVVRRCANHWRLWAQRQRLRRGRSGEVLTPATASRPTSGRRSDLLPPRGLKSALEEPSKALNGVPPLARMSANQRLVFPADKSRSPVIVAPRPRPRLPDFLMASVEASMLKRKEENLLRKVEPPCYRLDEADINQSEVVTSFKSQPIKSPEDDIQPIEELEKECATKRELPSVNSIREYSRQIKFKDHGLKSTNQIDSPTKHLILNGEKHHLSPSRGVRQEKLALMTPEMFMGSDNQSHRGARVTDTSANPGGDSVPVLGDLTNRRANIPPVRYEVRPETDVTFSTHKEELTSIRNKLRAFRNRKCELSLLESQAASIEQLLSEEQDQTLHHQLLLLHRDISVVTNEIQEMFPESEKLAARARVLIAAFAGRRPTRDTEGGDHVTSTAARTT